MKSKINGIKHAKKIVNNKLEEIKDSVVEVTPKAKEKAIQFAENTQQAIVEGANDLSDKVQKEIIEFNRRNNHPVFSKEDIRSEIKPSMIRIIPSDKRKNLIGCEHAIGFTKIKPLNILEMYVNKVSEFDYTFYPSAEDSIYYVDPFNPNHFIDLEYYFAMVKKAKVNELKNIAFSLGAKHFSVTFKVERANFVKKKVEGSHKKEAKIEKIKVQEKEEAKYQYGKDDYESIEIGAEMYLNGGEPQMPELQYFKNDEDIISLINMRMSKINPIHSMSYDLKYSNSSQINQNIAIKIDEALSQFKMSGTLSALEQVKREQRTIMNYKIDF
ncbi:hypothetical protein [Floccifex sp.]|uniref:hypothetical protein n=1 Tax=Floccifex sp. TaxID=2815810 RepID=UPI003F0E5BBB